jgi:hypothetical protein
MPAHCFHLCGRKSSASMHSASLRVRTRIEENRAGERAEIAKGASSPPPYPDDGAALRFYDVHHWHFASASSSRGTLVTFSLKSRCPLNASSILVATPFLPMLK